ncbi:PhzF family phenazine biosynthesis isomerase [Streptomyces sp. CB01881]|uniref:PhzF family phenazine biosynthesis protein n=1 Tax=Streptomyces sp. CB01881 TaxID=2078691 RepID=UPI000CDC688E|nr:PhzF family phenazine biosynthesis isomerase [Streptomyces sp. CB01881]AUY48142.1 phenazine biosynthesis protein PhzF [Streptomyces sp. CB01881]TYC76627.1 PhzF family phenazine biosynthesis isomerase [Streptomyces sp. CB01881]
MTSDAAPLAAPETDILRYSAFATDPGGGNPAGVVLDASGLSAERMLAIAAEVGYSETAFLIPDASGDAGGAYTVRYFSPLAEVPFCGHATVASAVALADWSGPGRYVFATQAGEVPIEVDKGADGVLRATLTSVEPHVEEVGEADVAEALALLGWSADELDAALPPRIGYAGARHLVLAAATRDRLARLEYDFDGLAAYMTARDLTTLQLVWRESEHVFHVRDPFPVGGVVEDPATGAAAAAFGAYLRERGAVTVPATLTLHQGEDLGRPGVLTVGLREGDTRIRVSGTAVPIP